MEPMRGIHPGSFDSLRQPGGAALAIALHECSSSRCSIIIKLQATASSCRQLAGVACPLEPVEVHTASFSCEKRSDRGQLGFH